MLCTVLQGQFSIWNIHLITPGYASSPVNSSTRLGSANYQIIMSILISPSQATKPQNFILVYRMCVCGTQNHFNKILFDRPHETISPVRGTGLPWKMRWVGLTHHALPIKEQGHPVTGWLPTWLASVWPITDRDGQSRPSGPWHFGGSDLFCVLVTLS